MAILSRQHEGAASTLKKRVTKLGFQQLESRKNKAKSGIRASDGVFVLGPQAMFKSNALSVDYVEAADSDYVWIPGYLRELPATLRFPSNGTNIYKTMQPHLPPSTLARFALCVGK